MQNMTLSSQKISQSSSHSMVIIHSSMSLHIAVTNRNIHVYGYQEEGTITTPFDMRVQNEIDRFNLVKNAISVLPQLGNTGAYLIQQMNDKLVEHKQYIHEYGIDLPEVRDWKWDL